MAEDTPDDKAQKEAAALVGNVVKDSTVPISPGAVQEIVEAIAQALGTAASQAGLQAERLAKLETQTRVLSDAVVAITETSDTLAPAVQAVKDEMSVQAVKDDS